MFTYKTMIIASVALIFSGCAEVEVAPGKQSHLNNAPINESSRAGIVSYSKEAINEEEERQDAYNEMAKSCNGAYKILKEEVKKGNGDYLDDKELVIGLDDTRVYITFKCINTQHGD